MLRKLKITLLFLFIIKLNAAQGFFDNSGLKIGLVYEIGQPIHRLGAMAGLHFNKYMIQLSTSHTFFYAFKNYGPKTSRWEVQSDLILGIAFGKSTNLQENISMLSPASNFSSRKNMISYGIKEYWDNIGTTQLTGSINLRIGNYFFITENDAFVFLPYDKFRTGALSFGRYFFTNGSQNNIFSQQLVSLDVLLYTGQTQGNSTEKIANGNYPSRFGYKKLNNSAYSKSSHGILKLSWQTSLTYGQNAFTSVGIDNEHIRNFVQNKVIHDLPFLPKQLIKINNPHIPMRNNENTDYLYRKNETVRKGKLVWGLGINRPFFY